MHYQNLEKLKRLRLFGMARALEELQNLADRASWTSPTGWRY